MGTIKENKLKRKQDDAGSVIGNYGDRKKNTNKVDFDEETIHDQKNKQ